MNRRRVSHIIYCGFQEEEEVREGVRRDALEVKKRCNLQGTLTVCEELFEKLWKHMLKLEASINLFLEKNDKINSLKVILSVMEI